MNNLIKYLSILLIVIGIPVLKIDPSDGSDTPLLVGLFILFVSEEKKDDERAVSIKTSSSYIALILSYGIKLLSTNLYSHHLISFQLTEINHFLIMLFAMAIIIYHSRMYFTSK